MMRKEDVYVIHGTVYKEMAMQVMEEADVAGDIGDRNRSIALKPNLVTASSPDYGATTHGELLDGAITYLQDHGFRKITVMESSWVGERTANALRSTGYMEICRRHNVPFEDLKKDSSREYDARGMRIRVCNLAMSVDYMINMPVLKGHCQTRITCALKNNKGVIPDSEKRRFHTLGLHKPIAHLNTVVRNDFILVDNICGDLEFEEGGNPVIMNRVLGFKDPVLCDAFVCRSMGYELEDVPYILMAEKLGVGSADLSRAEFHYLNSASREQIMSNYRTGKVGRLAAYTNADDACSACYGMLIHALNRLDEKGQLPKSRGMEMEKIAIGQGFRGKTGCIGIGNCTKDFDKNLKGCPPLASDILSFLERSWVR